MGKKVTIYSKIERGEICWGERASPFFIFLIATLLCFQFLLKPATAGEFTIPWTVDLTIPAVSVVPPFDGSYTALEFNSPVGPDTLGLTFDTEHEHSYTLHLPFEITVSAPDQVSPGQFVTLESSAQLIGTPSFTTAGSVDFNTSLFADDMSITLGVPGLTETLSYGGVSLTIAGEESYTNTDTSADEKFTRTIWREDPYGEPLQLNTAERFEGYELQTTGDMDAWGGEVALLQFASNFIPPPIGPLVNLVSNIMDLSVGPEFDIIEETYLTTQFVSGFYTDDGGATYDDFLINGADRKGYLTIPDTVTPGGTYDIQMTALGLGFTTLFDYILQGNIDIELEVLFGLYDIDIAEIPLGSAFLVDSWVDRFQFVEFMNPAFGGFLTAAEYANSYLSFDIIGGLADQDPGKVALPWDIARIDPLIGTLLDTGADQSQQSYEFPGDAPSATASAVEAVPEPSTLMLLSCGLLGMGWFGRRKN